MRGFMLIEALVAVAVMAVLAVFVAPSLSFWTMRDRVDAQVRMLLATFAYARSEVLRTGAPVIVCRLDDAGRCIPASRPGQEDSGDWARGYAVATAAAAPAPPRILRVIGPARGVTMTASSTPITFTPPAGLAVNRFRSFDVAPAAVGAVRDVPVRCVRLAASGRARVENKRCGG